MNFFNHIAKHLPFFLPLLLCFSRLIADITVITISILFLTKSFYEKDFHWLTFSWIKVFILFFIFLLLVNTPLSSNPSNSLFYSITFIRWPLFAIAIFIWILRDEKSLDYLLFGSLLVSFIYLIDLLFQFYINKSGLFEFISNPDPYRLSVPFSTNLIPGRFLIYLSLFITSIIFYRENKIFLFKSFSKILLTLMITFFLIIITGERMSFMIFLSCILFIQFALIYNQKNLLLKIIIFNVILIVFYLSLTSNNPQIHDRSYSSTIHKLINFLNSDYGVVFISSVKKWLQNPFFGSGIHQFRSIEPIYGFGILDKIKLLHAHNYPLNLLVETGITGLIFFYTIIYFLINEIFLKTRANFPLMIFLLIFLYVSFFPLHSHFSLSHNWINAIAWFSVGLMLAISSFYEKNNKN